MARKTTPTADPIAVGYGRKSLVKSNRDEVTVEKQKARVSAEAELRRERPAGQFERNGLGWLIMLVVVGQKELKNV